MAALGDLKTSTKLTGAFLAVALIVVVVAVLGYVSIESVHAGMTTMYADRLLPAQQLGNVNDARLTVQVDLDRFILAPEDRGELERDIAAHIQLADQNIKDYEATYLIPDEEGALAAFKPAWARYERAVAEALEQVRAGNEQAARRSVATGGAVCTARDEVDQIVTELIEIQVRVGASIKHEGDQTFRQAAWTMTVAGFGGVLLAIALGLVISRNIAVPLVRISHAARNVAGGNLAATADVAIKTRDEIGIFAAAFNHMTAQLRDLIGGLEQRNQQLQQEIVERQKLQAEREALIVELEAKNSEMERFTYIVSHDLRSPLITIKGFVGYMDQDAQAGNSEKIRGDAARIAHAADRMQQLLDELLCLSRIGRVVNPPKDVAFGELVAEALALVAGQVRERGVQVDIAPDLPVVCGDRARLIEVLQNLIDNAVKFMGDQPQPRVEIGARRDGAETVLYVQDNGIGIEPRYHEKVFGLFEKLTNATAGSGAGLAIVKRVIEVHDGRIWVESEGPGHGSCFCFTLPPESGALTEVQSSGR